jgi:hypothetical protein
MIYEEWALPPWIGCCPLQVGKMSQFCSVFHRTQTNGHLTLCLLRTE